MHSTIENLFPIKIKDWEDYIIIPVVDSKGNQRIAQRHVSEYYIENICYRTHISYLEQVEELHALGRLFKLLFKDYCFLAVKPMFVIVRKRGVWK